MYFDAPTHKNNTFDVLLKGNFRDSKDSFYSISEKDFVHITFVKREDKTIWEEVRSLMMIETIDEFFPNAEPDIMYRSNYTSVAIFDGLTMQHVGGMMSHMNVDDFKQMMIDGGRSVEGNKSIKENLNG